MTFGGEETDGVEFCSNLLSANQTEQDAFKAALIEVLNARLSTVELTVNNTVVELSAKFPEDETLTERLVLTVFFLAQAGQDLITPDQAAELTQSIESLPFNITSGDEVCVCIAVDPTPETRSPVQSPTSAPGTSEPTSSPTLSLTPSPTPPTLVPTPSPTTLIPCENFRWDGGAAIVLTALGGGGSGAPTPGPSNTPPTPGPSSGAGHTCPDVCDAGRPESLTFQYNPSATAISPNQNGKASVTGAVSATVSIMCDTADTVPFVVREGGLFVMTPQGGRFSAYTSCTLIGNGSQTATFHSSCSVPLEIGDNIGSFQLVGSNGVVDDPDNLDDAACTHVAKTKKTGGKGRGKETFLGHAETKKKGAQAYNSYNDGPLLLGHAETKKKGAQAYNDGPQAGSSPKKSEAQLASALLGTKKKQPKHRLVSSMFETRFPFDSTITGCPLIDDAVVRGANRHRNDSQGCGFNGKNFNCDHWNLTLACNGSPAGEPGSDAMVAVCSHLCDLVEGCDGYMLDHSYDEHSGLCTLHAGLPMFTESCFFYSGASGITTTAECSALSCKICGRGSKRGLTSVTFRWESAAAGSSIRLSALAATPSNDGLVVDGGVISFVSNSYSNGRLRDDLRISTPDGTTAAINVGCTSTLVLNQPLELGTGRLLLVGFSDETGQTEQDLDCYTPSVTVPPTPGPSNTPPTPGPSSGAGHTCPDVCDAGRPESLTFQYNPSATAISPNQNGKASVTGAVSATVSIMCDTADTVPFVVREGGLFVMTPQGGRFSAYTSCTLIGNGSQTATFHSSCSVPLEIGDNIGSFQLVGSNGVVDDPDNLDDAACTHVAKTKKTGGKGRGKETFLGHAETKKKGAQAYNSYNDGPLLLGHAETKKKSKTPKAGKNKQKKAKTSTAGKSKQKKAKTSSKASNVYLDSVAQGRKHAVSAPTGPVHVKTSTYTGHAQGKAGHTQGRSILHIPALSLHTQARWHISWPECSPVARLFRALSGNCTGSVPLWLGFPRILWAAYVPRFAWVCKIGHPSAVALVSLRDREFCLTPLHVRALP